MWGPSQEREVLSAGTFLWPPASPLLLVIFRRIRTNLSLSDLHFLMQSGTDKPTFVAISAQELFVILASLWPFNEVSYRCSYFRTASARRSSIWFISTYNRSQSQLFRKWRRCCCEESNRKSDSGNDAFSPYRLPWRRGPCINFKIVFYFVARMYWFRIHVLIFLNVYFMLPLECDITSQTNRPFFCMYSILTFNIAKYIQEFNTNQLNFSWAVASTPKQYVA